LAWQRNSSKEDEKLLHCLSQYRGTLLGDAQLIFDSFRPAGISFKVLGLAGLGTEDYILPFFGNSVNEILTLQFRPSYAPCVTPYVADAPHYTNQGQRIAEAQRTLQASDPFLGFTSIDHTDYLVRTFRQNHCLLNPLELKGPLLLELAQVCAMALAKVHARTGDAAMIVGYIGQGDKFDEAVTRFALSYAVQVSEDFELFLGAVQSGTIQTTQHI
jgi:hypothetical protein